jgi:hypothetical protein
MKLVNDDARCLNCYIGDPVELARAAERANSNGIVIEVASAEAEALEFLAEYGIYGPSADDVATYLIIRGLDDLTRAGVLPRIVKIERAAS